MRQRVIARGDGAGKGACKGFPKAAAAGLMPGIDYMFYIIIMCAHCAGGYARLHLKNARHRTRV